VGRYSGDRRITRNRAEYHTFRNSNLIGLFLSVVCTKRLSPSQMERILALWENIETVCQNRAGRRRVRASTKSTKLRQLKV